MSAIKFLLLFSLATLLFCHLGQAVVHIIFDYSQLAQITGKVDWTFTAQLMKQDEKTGIWMGLDKMEIASRVFGERYKQSVSLSVPEGKWPMFLTVEVGATEEKVNITESSIRVSLGRVLGTLISLNSTTQIEFLYRIGGQRVEITLKKDAADKPMYGLILGQGKNTIKPASGNKRRSPKKEKEAESSKRPKISNLPTQFVLNSQSIDSNQALSSVQKLANDHSSINYLPYVLNSDQTIQMPKQPKFDALSAPYQNNPISGSNVRPMNQPHIGTNSNVVHRPDHTGSDHTGIVDNRVPQYQQGSFMNMLSRPNVQQMPRNLNVGNDLHSMGQGSNHGSAQYTDSNMPSQSHQQYPRVNVKSNMPFSNPQSLGTNMASLSGTHGLSPDAMLDQHNLNEYGHLPWDQFVKHIASAVQRPEIPPAAWPASSASGSDLTVSPAIEAHQQQQSSKLTEERDKVEDDDDDHELIQNLLNVEEPEKFDEIFSGSKKQA